MEERAFGEHIRYAGVQRSTSFRPLKRLEAGRWDSAN